MNYKIESKLGMIDETQRACDRCHRNACRVRTSLHGKETADGASAPLDQTEEAVRVVPNLDSLVHILGL